VFTEETVTLSMHGRQKEAFVPGFCAWINKFTHHLSFNNKWLWN